MNNEEHLLTIEDLSEYLRISVGQVYILINRKDNPLPVFYLSDRTPRIRMDDLKDWITKQIEDTATKINN